MNKARKKLSLRTDTIRTLDVGALPAVNGGVATSPKPTSQCTMPVSCPGPSGNGLTMCAC